MVTGGYTAEQFVHAMINLVETETDQEKIIDQGSGLMKQLISNPNCIPPEYRVAVRSIPPELKKPNRGGYVLHRDPNGGLLINVVVLGPGAHVPPHNHGTWSIVGVMQGGLQETRFRRVDDGSRPGYGQLEHDDVIFTKPGEVSIIRPNVNDIHQVDNPGNETTVEIHAYGVMPTGEDHVQFNLETGRTTPIPSHKMDNE